MPSQPNLTCTGHVLGRLDDARTQQLSSNGPVLLTYWGRWGRRIRNSIPTQEFYGLIAKGLHVIIPLLWSNQSSAQTKTCSTRTSRNLSKWWHVRLNFRVAFEGVSVSKPKFIHFTASLNLSVILEALNLLQTPDWPTDPLHSWPKRERTRCPNIPKCRQHAGHLDLEQ